MKELKMQLEINKIRNYASTEGISHQGFHKMSSPGQITAKASGRVRSPDPRGRVVGDEIVQIALLEK